MMRARTLLAFAVLIGAATSVVACSESEGEKGCFDMAEAAAKSAEQCDVAHGEAFGAFVDQTGGCDFDSLRDKPSFYGVCIPTILGLSCETLKQPVVELPPECKDQLVKE